MSLPRLLLVFCILLSCFYSKAQQDSTVLKANLKSDSVLTRVSHKLLNANNKADSLLHSVQDIPEKYFKQVERKIDKYSERVTSKTEKTLTKLSKWENKIKVLLDKASPQTSVKLFNKNQVTFTSLLHKLQEGKSIATKTTKRYDAYRDKLTTSLKYLESQKNNLDSNFIEPVVEASDKMKELNADVDDAEAVAKFIKDRKKQLINESIKYIGKSKYLTKINRESYYYVETLRNYKEIFSDPVKAEETAKSILNKIPAFKKFTQQNSMLASLFGNSGGGTGTTLLEGLQTRADINALVQQRLTAGGPDAQSIIQQNMQQVQSEMRLLKDKILKAGGNSSEQELPDFKPNKQKSKTFWQRVEYGMNYQFAKSNNLIPASTDIAVTMGYKLNDKSVAGIGIAYKLGLGSIDNFHLSHQGIGLRSYMDWKLKKQFLISGGFEMNHNSGFKKVKELEDINAWQHSGLIGISKKFSLKTKFTKGTKISLLYDFLHRQHVPVSQPLIFRIGYNF